MPEREAQPTPVQSDRTPELLKVAEIIHHRMGHHPGEGERRPACTHAEAVYLLGGLDTHVMIQRAEYIVWGKIYAAS